MHLLYGFVLGMHFFSTLHTVGVYEYVVSSSQVGGEFTYQTTILERLILNTQIAYA